MLYLTCTTISSVDLAHYGVSRAKDSVSVEFGTKYIGVCGNESTEYSFSFVGPKSRRIQNIV